MSYIATASSSATLYPAINMSYEQIRQPWRSTDTASQTIVFDLSAQMAPSGIMLQHCNFTTFTIATSTDNITYTTAVTYTNHADTAGRYKTIVPLTGTFMYVKLSIPSQTRTGGEGYYYIGAAYIFSTVSACPTNPQYGANVNVTYPQTRTDLPNGKTITIDIGASYSEISGTWPDNFTQDSAASIRRGIVGIIGIDMEMSNALWMIWPVRVFDGKINRVIQDYSVWPTNFTFKEVV